MYQKSTFFCGVNMFKKILLFGLINLVSLTTVTFAQSDEEIDDVDTSKLGQTSEAFPVDIHHCKIKRGAVNYKTSANQKWAVDSILWCPDEYRKIMSCNSLDDTSPLLGPTKMIDCLKDGACKNQLGDQRGSREGPQNQYHEFVAKTPGIGGCWTYDRKGQHRPFRVEILCCK